MSEGKRKIKDKLYWRKSGGQKENQSDKREK